MSVKKEKRANLDIYLVSVIMVLVLTIGGAMWVIGKSLDVRLDELSVRLTSQTGQIRSELFEMRKDLEQLTVLNRQQSKTLQKLALPAPAAGGPAPGGGTTR